MGDHSILNCLLYSCTFCTPLLIHPVQHEMLFIREGDILFIFRGPLLMFSVVKHLHHRPIWWRDQCSVICGLLCSLVWLCWGTMPIVLDSMDRLISSPQTLSKCGHPTLTCQFSVAPVSIHFWCIVTAAACEHPKAFAFSGILPLLALYLMAMLFSMGLMSLPCYTTTCFSLDWYWTCHRWCPFT